MAMHAYSVFAENRVVLIVVGTRTGGGESSG